MTKYFALAADDFFFFDNAMARHAPEQKGDWIFRQTPGGYLPEEYSLQDPNVLRWHREYLQKKTPMRNAHDTRTFFRHSLLQHFMDSHTFIPLNNRPSQWLAQSGLTYVLPDSFVASVQEWNALVRPSESIISELIERVDLDGMGWSVNWATYYVDHMMWLFFPVHLAAKIGQSISSEGGELVCALNHGEAYTTHLMPSNLPVAIWKHYLGDALREIRYNTPCVYSPYSTDMIDYSALRGAVLFTGLAATVERFYPAALHTAESCDKPVVVASLSRNYNPFGVAEQYEKGALHIGGISLMPLPGPDKSAAGEIEGACALFRDILTDHMPGGQKAIEITAEYLATFFWRTENVYQKLVSLFAEHRPALCFGEANDGCEPSTMLFAARSLGIPTVGMPHSQIPNWGKAEHIVPTDRYAMPNRMAVAMLRKRLPDAKAQSFVQIDMTNEYLGLVAQPIKHTPEKLNILVALTAHTGHSPLILSYRGQGLVEWLSQMKQIPRSLQDTLVIRYKMHPRFHSYDVLRKVRIPQSAVLPPQTPMSDALTSTDMVISCNYFGPPAMQAYAQGIPVVFCLSEECVMSAHPAELIRTVRPPYVFSRPEHFWKDIVPLLINETKRSELILHQLKFARQWLVPDSTNLQALINETG
jgi:hypothetical protein